MLLHIITKQKTIKPNLFKVFGPHITKAQSEIFVHMLYKTYNKILIKLYNTPDFKKHKPDFNHKFAIQNSLLMSP